VKIVVTGANGRAGRPLCQQLAGSHQVIAADVVDPRIAGVEFAATDLSKYAQVRRAVEGAEVICHVAALHPWRRFTDRQYLETNVKGTYWVLKAAHDAGVRRVVFVSSIWAVGHGGDPPSVPVAEEAPLRGDELYGLTKVMGEHACEYFSRTQGLQVIILRPAGFGETEALWTGPAKFATAYVDVRDVAHAIACAATAEVAHRLRAYWVTPRVPYEGDDWALLGDDPGRLMEKHWPGAAAWCRQQGLDIPRTRWAYNSARTERELGYNPRYNFTEFIREQLARES
jgi:nucleoside-diphosphate-sugar epimerase